jgi:hypothetical protein
VWLVALIGWVFWTNGLLPSIANSAGAVAVLESVVFVALGLMVGSAVFWFFLGFLSQRRAHELGERLRGIPKIGGALEELWRAGWLYRCRAGSVGLALVLAMIGHFGFVLVFYFSSRTLNLPEHIPPLQTHTLLVPVGMTISAGIPTPGAVGGGEFVYGKLYEILGFAFAAGVLGSLMQRCINWGLGLAGYLVYLRLKPGLAKVGRTTRATEQQPLSAACEQAG